jgi:hypothetical protein
MYIVSSSHAYLIIVISFTWTRFLELKIYTQMRVNQDKLDFATNGLLGLHYLQITIM